MDKSTIVAYNTFSTLYSKKFNKMGKRTAETSKVIAISPKPLSILELGCGNGRDAKTILKFTKNYQGLDASKNFISIAKKSNPNVKFKHQDITAHSLSIKNKLSTVISFDTLIHLSARELRVLFLKLSSKLLTNGVIYATFKYGRYKKVTFTDATGKRSWYLYNPSKIKKLIPKTLKITRTEILNPGLKKLRNTRIGITIKKIL